MPKLMTTKMPMTNFIGVIWVRFLRSFFMVSSFLIFVKVPADTRLPLLKFYRKR